MADTLLGSTNLAPAPPAEQQPAGPGQPPAQQPIYDDARILELFDTLKRESMDYRWVFEKEWLRDQNYVGNRQWITYHPSRREWIDKRLHKWIPRPVTNKMAEIVQSIRTNFGAINLTVKVRPVGNTPVSQAAAEIADQMSPMIHEEHDMNQVMREADYWLITAGSVVLQTSWDRDIRSNRLFVASEQCLTCGTVNTPKVIQQSGNICPTCGGQQFQAATDQATGQPVGEWLAFGKGKTTALSPFEWAVPVNITRFDELPYLIRIRWRDKHWFEANAPDLVPKITWEKSPSDRSMQIYKSLATSNDIGGVPNFMGVGSSGGQSVDGITEYELWLKPTPEFPQGLVCRIIGDNQPIVLHMPEEGLPGPFPYKDIQQKPIFPFTFAQYEHVGGRLYGRSAISPLIQKQDQLNQLDSLIQLIVQRMANPIWVVPEGAGIDTFSGEPGFVMKWNPLAAGGTAKPERIAGSEVPTSLQLLRAQILKDIEELSGAFDIIKGQKPSGVEAFSALQLLVERSQSRFTSVFQSRGEMYRKWFAIAIELERQFGPEQRVMTVVGPNRGFTFQQFQNAQLQGDITIALEDGSNMPKTALGKRAAIEQANQLRLLDPSDPDQRYALLNTFGLSDLVPTLDYHVQAALKVQDDFERWAVNPMGPPPLVFKPWFDPMVHWVEHIKWLNTDRMRDMLAQNPMLEPIVIQHLQQLQFIMNPPVQVGPDGQPIQQGPGGQPGGPPQPGGGGRAMANSNQNAGAPNSSQPSGNKQFGPNVGPA
jgi:hypothetical protein